MHLFPSTGLILCAVSSCGSLLREPVPPSPPVTRPSTTRNLGQNGAISRKDGNRTTPSVPDLSRALGTMYFHRSKMNEYLCHKYLAGEILTDLAPLQSRSDGGAEEDGKKKDFRVRTTGPDALLKDQGSESYKDWLEKSAQLQDLWAEGAKGGATPHGFETGDVTGFATVAGGKGGAGGYGYPPAADPWPANSHGWQDFSGDVSAEWEWEGDEEELGKGLVFSKLFDLAISALAFLAFGLFVLNIIIACFSKKTDMTVVMATTTEASTRSRRDVESERLNELARRVLTSVDRLQEMQDQRRRPEEGCLAYSLCDNNKFSRALPDSNRIWLPVWSLGMSWLAGQRLMDHLRASILGFGDADCHALYPRCASTTY